MRRLFKSMQDGADRIQAIVLSLRNFSRLDESQIKLVDLHEGLESTLLLLQHRLKTTVSRSQISVIKTYGDLPKVECYPGHLNQVFMSILNNAIDALEDSMKVILKEAKEIASLGTSDTFLPTIWIETKVVNSNWIMIRIWDNANGMTPETLSKMFDPFFTTKAIGKGTGLGLSISYQIVVTQHNGNLSGRSELGKGSEFAIEIPIKQVRV
ncbi:sensor histidine kinase [Phormidesmis sp. 146-33]